MLKGGSSKRELGKLVLPLVIGGAAILLNAQISQRQLASAKLDIALGVLSQEPSDGTNALRKWAIEVLQDPHGDNELGESAAAELRKQALALKPE